MKTVAILSGGLDSTTMVYDLKQQGDEVLCLSFDYGQKHRKELQFAQKTTSKLNLEHRIIDISNIHNSIISSNALTGAGDVPEGHYADDVMRQTVVPFRNSIMLIISAGIASNLNYDRVAYAAHTGDHSIYPDCRPEFVEAMQNLMQVADYNKIALYSPYQDITKTEIVRRGVELGIDYADTWSCYKGRDVSCGRCGTCVERTEAFHNNNLLDPLYNEKGWNEAVDFMKQELKKQGENHRR